MPGYCLPGQAANGPPGGTWFGGKFECNILWKGLKVEAPWTLPDILGFAAVSGAGLVHLPRWFQKGVSCRQSYWSRWCCCCCLARCWWSFDQCWCWLLLLNPGDWDLEAWRLLLLFMLLLLLLWGESFWVPFLDKSLAFKNSIDFDLWRGRGLGTSASNFSSNILSTLLPRGRDISFVVDVGLEIANRKIWDEWRMSSGPEKISWLCWKLSDRRTTWGSVL